MTEDEDRTRRHSLLSRAIAWMRRGEERAIAREAVRDTQRRRDRERQRWDEVNPWNAARKARTGSRRDRGDKPAGPGSEPIDFGGGDAG